MGLTRAERHNRMMDRVFASARALQRECRHCRRLYYKELAACPLCHTPSDEAIAQAIIGPGDS